MAPEVKARAFEPFFTTKDVGRGSGLGLATLHGFVRQSGGFVTLYSEPGRGTVVHVHLPSVDAAEPCRPATTASEPHRGAGQRILLVDDDASVRRVTRERLLALGYAVETASDPAEAIAVLGTRGRFDLVFTDIVMPGGVSGLDLARSLRAADPGCRILVTSGFTEDFLGGPASAEIEFRFLRKPHSLAELASAVAEALAT
jgi:CheY-like chemotaxis protein